MKLSKLHLLKFFRNKFGDSYLLCMYVDLASSPFLFARFSGTNVIFYQMSFSEVEQQAFTLDDEMSGAEYKKDELDKALKFGAKRSFNPKPKISYPSQHK